MGSSSPSVFVTELRILCHIAHIPNLISQSFSIHFGINYRALVKSLWHLVLLKAKNPETIVYNVLTEPDLENQAQH